MERPYSAMIGAMLDDEPIVSAAWLTLERLAAHDPRVAGILIETVADNLREGYRVQAWCWRCSRAQDVDLSELVRRGLGVMPFVRVSRAFRCRRCGCRGQIIRTPQCEAYPD